LTYPADSLPDLAAWISDIAEPRNSFLRSKAGVISIHFTAFLIVIMSTEEDRAISQLCSTHIAFLLKVQPFKHCERKGWAKKLAVGEIGF
jgi:hypothetical protein